MKRTEQIKVNSENFFPIIKKWLYSDKDIFLREIVANSCDAIKKYQSLCLMGEIDNDNIKPRIDIKIDKEAKTLIVRDNGIGMTEEEVEKYIAQIAFSGAQEFIEKYQDKIDNNSGIIGHFGLGFYSAYMVSDMVEIETLSYIPNAKPIHWDSDGSSTYNISDGIRTEKGTTVVMHISDDGKEFLDDFNLREVLKKYCHFMPYEIYLNDNNINTSESNTVENISQPINNTTPLWLKAPRNCTTKEYEDFYKEVFADYNPPLFWIHLNVDYPFNLKGILYFPKQTDKLQVLPGEIKLFANQVYIADNIKEVVPEFLMLLKGVIDCPDLPLNVSRSFLQNDSEVAKISNHITKKVADKLVSIFKNEHTNYENYWEDISPFIKFGCIKDEKFYEKIKDTLIFKSIDGKYKTLSELSNQENDENKVYYVSNQDMQAQYIKLFKDNDIEAVILEHNIDNHFISFLEYKVPNIKFVRIDAEINNTLKSKETTEESELNTEIIEIFKKSLEIDNLEIQFEPLKSTNIPAIITVNEYERRMNDMNKLYGNMFGVTPKAKETLIINAKNSIINKLSNLDENNQKLLCQHIYDLAVVSQRKLTADELEIFISRSIQILNLI